MHDDLNAIIKQFNFTGQYSTITPYGNGHINDTYAVTFHAESGETNRYILQRINHQIFKQPEALMQNVEKVTAYLKKKILASGGTPARECLTLINTFAGQTLYRSPAGNYWRAYLFIEGAQTYEVVEKMEHIYNAAWAFGHFQHMLNDFPVNELTETIPDFHHTPKRYQAFVEAVQQDRFHRAANVQDEINFAMARADETSLLVDMQAEGKLPLRVTHNDTKFNNVMIDDETGKGICILDLDTVMPGLSLYDFGEIVRTGANLAPEDAQDLSGVHLDLATFDVLTHGYLDAANKTLTPNELDFLPYGPKMMAYENGIRFLTDYLQGDIYFKIHREDQNLDRCRTQFKLVTDMENKFQAMHDIVNKYRSYGG
ncbi:MAG: aminoglycoside phosphotransferase family protein [Anaerolineae bacterium]|nr:aminoglycoside phosphotransferase family protein [Anaerolineae bacterium]